MYLQSKLRNILARSRGSHVVSIDTDFTETRTENRLKRNHFNGASLAFDSQLVVAGGGQNPRTSSSEIISAKNSEYKWQNWATMAKGLSGLQLIRVNNYIYASGGYDGKDSALEIHRIDISCFKRGCSKTPSWEHHGNMVHKRDGHLSLFFANSIYTLGGEGPGKQIVQQIQNLILRLLKYSNTR